MSPFSPKGLSPVGIPVSFSERWSARQVFLEHAGVPSLNVSGLIISLPVYLKPEDAGITFLPLKLSQVMESSAALLAVLSAFWG